jgi:hypothetical protein
MSAAEPGFKGMTSAYSSLVHGGTRKLSGEGDTHTNHLQPVFQDSLPRNRMGAECTWKVRGVGLVTLSPLLDTTGP